MPFGAIGAAVAGSAVSAGIGALTAKGQSSAVQGGVDAANRVSQAAINEAKGIYAPYQAAGTNALGSYGDLLGINGADAASRAMSNFQASPGYQYQLSQGLQSVDHGAAARGMLRSGETLRAEQTLGNNLANQDFSSYMGRLNTLAGLGLQGTQDYTSILSGQANSQQQSAVSNGAAQAGIYGNLGNQLGNAAGNVINSVGQYYTRNNLNGGGGGSSAWDGAGVSI